MMRRYCDFCDAEMPLEAQDSFVRTKYFHPGRNLRVVVKAEPDIGYPDVCFGCINRAWVEGTAVAP